MVPIFKNPSLQTSFSEQGYVTMPLLDEADTEKLLQLFNRHSEQYQTPFHTSHFSTDKHYKRQVNDAITEIVFPKAESLLANCRPIFANSMIKNPGSDYFMPLHADWTYVDENLFRSVAIWVPLVDTSKENGCLGVIEGSHKVLNKIRGPRIQQSSYEHDRDWVKQLGKLLPMKAGGAVIYDHALLHFSPPNKTAFVRPALNLSIVPKDAEIIHYCIPEGASVIEVYRVDDPGFYISYDNFQRPETNSLIRTLPVNSVEWIDSRMEKFTGQARSPIV